MSLNGVIKINKGFDIKLAGQAKKETREVPISDVVSVFPDDFLDTIPKLMVAQGDEIKAGDPLFYSKDRPDIKITSPVSGEVVEIRRGEKRKILEIRILADKTIRYKDFGKDIPTGASLVEKLQEAGVWAYFRQRPYNTIADPSLPASHIFISAFDSAPLAPDLSYVIGHKRDAFEKGVEILQKMGLTVHINISADASSETFAKISGVQYHTFSGKHPSGCVGVQIHHIQPINSASKPVWTIHPQDLAIIGDLFLTGQYMPYRVLHVGGSEVLSPRYEKVLAGTSLKTVLDNNLSNNLCRIIRGNVLTGRESSLEGAVGFYDNQISVIPEVTEPEFFGWLLPGFGKLSLSRTFFSWLLPKDNYVMNTSMNGEHRNFVVTGEYEKVLPMNILPVQLLKAIMAKDFEMMEKLGIYEVVEEDMALCEFVCTSKMPVQAILREGLDLMRKEG
jgi:Na+-transporting NADH:ubiquinone oxidoreductase subunit A